MAYVFCLTKVSSLDFIRHHKLYIKSYILRSINTSSSSSKSVVESKTAETYYGTLERIFELDFLTGSLSFPDLFQNDNPITFTKKRHLFYDKTNSSKSNNAQPALKKMFEYMASSQFPCCPCEKCTAFLNLVRGKAHNVSTICGSCLCGDKLHEGEAFGCHSVNSKGQAVCLGSKKCSSCNYRLPFCCYSKMFQGVKKKYELDNIITQRLYLCNKCFFKNNIQKQWGHQKKASTLHKSFYHTTKLKRKKRKLNTQIPKNNEVVPVANKNNLASHRKTATYISNYYKNLKKSLNWVKQNKSHYKVMYKKVIQGIIKKIERSKKITKAETLLLLKIVSKYEVIDQSFLKFRDKKKFVVVPKKMKRLELKENKRHIIYLSKKRKHREVKNTPLHLSDYDDADNDEEVIDIAGLTHIIKKTEEQKNNDRLFLWGLDRRVKKKKKIPKNKKNNMRGITDDTHTQ